MVRITGNGNMSRGKIENFSLRILVGRRLRQIRIEFGFIRQSEFGLFLDGVPGTTISNAETGKNFPSPRILVGLVERAGVDLNWLFTGKGDMFATRAALALRQMGIGARIRYDPDFNLKVQEGSRRLAAARSSAFKPMRILHPGYELSPAEALPADWRGRWVPILGRIAAGGGIDTVAAEQQPTGLADRFVRWSGRAARPFAAEVVGESMTPEFKPGDIVVADGERPCFGGICCVIFEEKGDRLIRLKRLHISGSRVTLESLNKAFQPVELEVGRFVAAYEIVAHLALAVAE